jgi:2-iminobutanoate/2-iminopropanoate deaminase
MAAETLMSNANTQAARRSILRSFLGMAAATVAGLFSGVRAETHDSRAAANGVADAQAPAQQPPLFSGVIAHGGLVFVAGKGEHGAGDIKIHTNSVLNQLEAELKKAGSSMDKVLKVNVYLHDLKDYDGMNEVFRGRFGPRPPVRTTVACYGGVPGQSLVEMDCIAAL